MNAVLCLAFVGALAGAGRPLAEKPVGRGARGLSWGVAALALAVTLVPLAGRVQPPQFPDRSDRAGALHRNRAVPDAAAAGARGGRQWGWLAPFRQLLPDRTVAALSAPMLVFTYSHWNLLPVQAAFWIGFGVCLAFARRAHGAERMLWLGLALLAAAGQSVHLPLGRTMLAIYDASEFRELFFVVGLAAYGWRQWRA